MRSYSKFNTALPLQLRLIRSFSITLIYMQEVLNLVYCEHFAEKKRGRERIVVIW